MEKVVDFLRQNDDFAIICHYDADGLTAGAIAALTLERLGKNYNINPTRQLDEERISRVLGKGDNYLFVDLGSGQIPVIEENFDSFAIVDHHETLGETKHPHFNAHLHGMDGAKEISGAGCTYLVSRALSKKNIDLSPIAVVGAVGDMQDSTGALVGKNREILADAVSAGLVEAKKDICLYGRHSRPLVQFLAFSSEPFFPGLTGDEVACELFLSELGIPLRKDGDFVYYADLNAKQKKKLVSGLFVHGKRNFVPEFILSSLVREVYELLNEQPCTPLRDAREFATVLNACGRHEEGEIGINVCMGDRGEALKEAEALLRKHRRLLREGLEFARNKGLEEREHCFVLDAGDNIQDTLVGVIAGMVYSFKEVSQDKPIIAFAVDEKGLLKISGRANWTLVRKGLHLGKALKKACSKLGGEGGGHSIAAGARIEPDKKEEFIRVFDGIVGKQLS